MNKSAILRIVAILILLTTPVLIYGMGLWATALEKEMSATFEYAPIIGKLFIANSLMVAWWLLIAWLVAFRDDREPVMLFFMEFLV